MSSRLTCLLAASLLTMAALPALAQGILVDHTSTNLAAVPDAAIQAAAAKRLMLRHASVGSNINSGLDALRTQNAKYDRSLWSFQARGNPGWQAKVDDLVTQTAAQSGNFDILTMKLCYIDSSASFTYYRDKMLQLEGAYPSKRFVWWTMPIETSGNTSRQSFNDQVRAYATANGKPLFDIADIESHDAAGVKRVDSSGRELMQNAWTSDGGHLNSAGALRVASAWWWLMARLAGWDPAGFRVSSIRPVSGSVAGGTPVTLSGSGFVSGTTVTIGGVAAGAVVVEASDRITAVTGAHATGLADVVVTRPGPTSATLASGFFFAPIPSATGYYPLTPCRAVDTRSGSPLSAGTKRVWTITGSCGVPGTARAVALSVTAIGASAPGYVVLAPGNGLSTSSAVNYATGSQARASNVVAMLATDGTGGLAATSAPSGSVHLVLDVMGYFQ